ncbi:MAG: GTP-binding protein HflX, partial [Colwellia sp.]
MFDRYKAGEQAILVHLDFPDENAREDLQEFELLVSSAGINSLNIITGKRNTPHTKFFVGSGKAEEIAEAV